MAKPPLLFIHGMWSTPAVWDDLVRHFEGEGYKCLAPALPFHERDGDNRETADPLLATIGVQDYVDALCAAVREAPAPPVIIGHSMGAMLAQLLADCQDDMRAAGLVLLSPGPTADTGSVGLAPLRTTLGITTKKNWWKSPTKIDPDRARWGIFNEVPEEVVQREIDALVWDSGRVLFQMSMPFADKTKATKVDYDKLTMPALVIVGDRDRITPTATARRTARRLKGDTDYVEIEGAGHWLFHDPVIGRVTEEVSRFLKTLDD
ncbi:MAG: alpha/beta hydrolase [Pseudomonadota bacterium]